MTAELSPGEARRFREFEHAGWGTAATAYENCFAPLVIQSVDSLLDAAGVRRGMKVLDVATGPGHVAAAAASRGAVATGVDFSAEMIRLARAAHPNLVLAEGDAEDLPFDAGTFDAVVMGFGLLHFGRPERALREAHRVLRSGGSFALSVWAPPARAVAFGILLDAIAACGESNEPRAEGARLPVPSGPEFFRFSDADECVRCLEAAGFVTPSVVTVSQTWRLATPEDLFDSLRHATVRTAALIGARPRAAQDEIRAAVTREARRFLGRRGVELPMPAVIASASRR